MATTITANGINFPDGSAGSPSIGGTDTNTGLFTGSDIVGFATGGSERLRIDASGNINIANDSGKLQLGTGADLKIYHDGSNSYIKNETGDLFIQCTGGTSDDISLEATDNIFLKVSGNEAGIYINGDAGVELYYDNSKKFETTSDGTLISGAIRTNAATSGAASANQAVFDYNTSDTRILSYNSSGSSISLFTNPNGGSLASRLYIDSSGKVSVGGETPIYNLNVRGSGQQTLLVGSTDAGGAYVTFDGDSNGDGQGGDYCHIGQTTSGDMELSADNPNGDANIIIRAGNAAEKLRVLSSGGLTFNGDTAAANALDDYEEGTFTPTYDTSSSSGSITVGGYAVQAGHYIKVGNLVYVEGGLKTSSAGVTNNSNGTWDIGGLPFTSHSGGSDGTCGELQGGAQADWSTAPHKFTVLNSNTRARARGGIDVGDSVYTQGATSMFSTGAGSNNRVYFRGCYIAA